MSKKKNDFNELVVEELKNPRIAAAYLNEHWHYRGSKKRELLLDALHNIAEAQGFTSLSRRSGISRRSLYSAFSKTGNPTLDTLLTLLDTVGIRIYFESEKNEKTRL
ncbi:MAG: hypothetical protein A2583_13875 [Bdellovibrionales bacterium RIFOXYD1_FULL_53_11]|nr:MAG: hypothetical protein A2583_13875 [Bdellovibrionales bacterium RIFOXYD1_FULL_53_11]